MVQRLLLGGEVPAQYCHASSLCRSSRRAWLLLSLWWALTMLAVSSLACPEHSMAVLPVGGRGVSLLHTHPVSFPPMTVWGTNRILQKRLPDAQG